MWDDDDEDTQVVALPLPPPPPAPRTRRETLPYPPTDGGRLVLDPVGLR